MKKMISLVLLLALTLSLFGCTTAKEPEVETPKGLQVGYARENITPEESVPMGGYGNTDKRWSKSYLDYLYVTCIAVTGTNGESVILFTMDLMSGQGSSFADPIRQTISEKTGVPVSNILFHGTHSHSTPSLASTEYPVVKTYREKVIGQIVAAAEAAWADRSETQLYTGRTTVEGMNFVRHYEIADGTYAGSNFGSYSAGIVGHAAPNDPEMLIAKFDRLDEAKQDIYMMNWAAHPCFTGGMDKYDLSADFIASARDYVEQQTGGLFAYFTGAAGNQNTGSQIDSEKHGLKKDTYGQKLGGYYVEALNSLTAVEGTEVNVVENIYEAQVNHELEELKSQALDIYNYFQDTGDRAAGNKMANEIGLSSVYHCAAIVNRSKLPATRNLILHAAHIGEFAFITAPYEMFAQSGMDIKSGSPYDTTFIISMQNGSDGYIPTKPAYDYGCYESHTGKYAPGTAELLVEEFVGMLEQLHG